MKSVVGPQTDEGRSHFIGGSDARIIMGQDEKALIRLWQEKRGEIGPEDLSGNLIVQLGLATEDLNRTWYERNTGRAITAVQTQVKHPVIAFMAATLDGVVAGTGAVYDPRHQDREIFSRDLGFRSRKPSPPPFPGRKSIPAPSKARRIFSIAGAETSLRSFSKSTTVERPKEAASASSAWVRSSKARAALHCAEVISTFFVDRTLALAYKQFLLIHGASIGATYAFD
jgi:hypothetical protein